MRFLVDECTGPAVARWLSENGHDVLSIYEQDRGCDDAGVLERANAELRILITNDRDFGEKVFREGRAHSGVVFLRLADERSASKIAVLERLLSAYGEHLGGRFVVASEDRIRFSRL
jgi:predicted nuclease of predicted toxin-antitoxin system